MTLQLSVAVQHPLPAGCRSPNGCVVKFYINHSPAHMQLQERSRRLRGRRADDVMLPSHQTDAAPISENEAHLICIHYEVLFLSIKMTRVVDRCE